MTYEQWLDSAAAEFEEEQRLARQAETAPTEDWYLDQAADLRDELYVLENPEEFN